MTRRITRRPGWRTRQRHFRTSRAPSELRPHFSGKAPMSFTIFEGWGHNLLEIPIRIDDNVSQHDCTGDSAVVFQTCSESPAALLIFFTEAASHQGQADRRCAAGFNELEAFCCGAQDQAD